MLFILFSCCSFAAVSLIRAIIKPVELRGQESPMEVCMSRGKAEREHSYGCWGASLPLSWVEAIHWRWVVLGSIISFWCPSVWFRAITVKAPAHRHATACPHLPTHWQVGMCTRICLRKERKNKTFKKYPAEQDKISSLFSALCLTVPRWSQFLFLFSISFLP